MMERLDPKKIPDRLSARSARIVRLLLYGGILLPLADLTLIGVFAAQHPDYSHLRQLMSELGEEGRPGSSLVNAWFTFSSFLLVGFGLAMGRQLPRPLSAQACAELPRHRSKV